MVGIVQAKPTHSPHLIPGVTPIHQTRKQRFQPKVAYSEEGACPEGQASSDVAAAISDHDVVNVRGGLDDVHALAEHTKAVL
jgi:hypothetical protein